MKRLVTALALAALGALAVAAAVPLHPERRPEPPRVLSATGARAPLLAGGASAPIEVTPGTPVAGYPRVLWPNRGVRDAPAARALAFRAGELTAVVASADLLLLPPALRARVAERLADLRLGALLVAATHTHAGPGGFWDDLFGVEIATGPYDPAREEAVVSALERAVRGAVAALEPARLAAGRAQVAGLTRSRSGGEVDGRLAVLRVERADPAGPPAAIGQVVVFPAHATVLGSRNRLVSGDWPAALARELPGTTVFLQGAVGDQSVALPGGTPDPETFARAVAGEIARLPFAPADPSPPLAAARAEVALPAPSFGAVPRFLGRLFSNLLHGWLPPRATVLALRAGPVLLAAVPAEPGAEVGRRWRAALGPDAEVVSLADGYLGYVETPQRVRDRTGEAVRTYLGPDLAFVLGDGVVAAAAAADAAAPAPAADPGPRPPAASP